MTLNKLPLKLSEEAQYNLAKRLYAEDGDGCGCAANGGLASASDLGPLPKVNFGGTGLGFETRRRRNRMQSEESYEDADEIFGRFMKKAYEWYHLDEDDVTSQPLSDDDSPPPKQDGANADVAVDTNEDAKSILQRIRSLYEGREPDYVVSWMDPRIVGRLHKDQHKLGNGLFYVQFDNIDKAKAFYKELSDQGIYNLKLDTLG